MIFFFKNNPKQKETGNKTQVEEDSQTGSVLKDLKKKPQSVSETNKKQEYWTYHFNH